MLKEREKKVRLKKDRKGKTSKVCLSVKERKKGKGERKIKKGKKERKDKCFRIIII